MPSTDPAHFPSPIGGIPLPRDLAPSIVFLCLFLFLLLLGVYRLFRLTTRHLLVPMTLGFVFERLIGWSLRSAESHTPSLYSNHHLMAYWQVTFLVGYIVLFIKLVVLLRCLVMNATEGIPSPDVRALEDTSKPNGDSETQSKELVEGAVVDVEDHTRTRRRYEKLFGAMIVVVIVIFILGAVSGNEYFNGETHREKAVVVKVLRQATSGISLALLLIFQSMLVYVHFTLSRIRRTALLLLFVVGCILMIIPIYHLIALNTDTTSLTSTERGSQNTTGEKVAFYVLQAAPEFLASAVLLLTNVKTMFGAGTLMEMLPAFASRILQRRRSAEAPV